MVLNLRLIYDVQQRKTVPLNWINYGILQIGSRPKLIYYFQLKRVDYFPVAINMHFKSLLSCGLLN